MIVLAAAMMAQMSVARRESAQAPTCAGFCDAERLRAVFAKLREARRTGRLVRIVQIGDSHTAGDQVTGSWRALLQERFGAGGRGILPPGRPYQGYLTRGVTVTQTGGWDVGGVFGQAYRAASTVPIALTGYSASTATQGAAMTLTATSMPFWFDRVTVCGVARPGAGAVTIAAGLSSETLPLGREEGEGEACRAVDLPAAADRVTVTANGGPVTLTSWSTEARSRGGVTLSNLGTVGAQLVHWTTRTNDSLIASELAAYRPDLIVVAFGTNEAFSPRFSAAAYAAQLRDGIERVKRLTSGVPILLLGAPDSATKLAGLQTGEAGEVGRCPPAAASITAPPAAPDDPPLVGGTGRAPASVGAVPRWAPPAALAVVQAIQQRTAHDMGLAFWNWSARMGGRCTADTWATLVPPLMRGDHVHFTTPGAAEIARRLDGDWSEAMARDEARIGSEGS